MRRAERKHPFSPLLSSWYMIGQTSASHHRGLPRVPERGVGKQKTEDRKGQRSEASRENGREQRLLEGSPGAELGGDCARAGEQEGAGPEPGETGWSLPLVRNCVTPENKRGMHPF